jgi:dolichol-phosphate mannosyltransferase
MKNKVSIVLPTFNEKNSLENTVLSILRFQKILTKYSFEIVISDSSSTDGTAEISQKIAYKYHNVHHINVGPGLGVGLYEGHKYALKNIKPDILIQMDADGQVSEETIPLLIGAIEDGADLALGSRFVMGGKNQLSLLRKCFSLGSSLFCRVVMGPFDIREFTNSARAFTPKLFNKINWERLPWRKKTFIVMPAFLNEAVMVGAKYKEVPLIFKNRGIGYSKNKIISYTLDMIVYSIEARLRKFGINVALFNILRDRNKLK